MNPPKAPRGQIFADFFSSWGYASFSGWLVGASQMLVGGVLGGGLGFILIMFGVVEVAMGFLTKGRGFDDPLPGQKPMPSIMPWSRRGARIFSCAGMLGLAAMQMSRLDGDSSLGMHVATVAAVVCAMLAGFCASMSPKAAPAPKPKA